MKYLRGKRSSPWCSQHQVLPVVRCLSGTSHVFVSYCTETSPYDLKQAVLLPQSGKHPSPPICKMAPVSITRNNREPSSKTQAGVEISKELRWVTQGCYVLLPQERKCVCTWEGTGLMDAKFGKNLNSLPFLLLLNVPYKKFIILKT